MRWLLLGAAVSAVLGLCCILLCRNYLLYCLLTHFLINTLMTVICFGRCDRRQFFENWLAVYLVVLLLGGAFEWLQESGILSKSRGVAIAAAVTVTCGLLRYLGRRRAFGSHVRRAWLGKDARRMALSAYWDSGNQLRDPYTGQRFSCDKSLRKSSMIAINSFSSRESSTETEEERQFSNSSIVES